MTDDELRVGPVAVALRAEQPTNDALFAPFVDFVIVRAGAFAGLRSGWTLRIRGEHTAP